MNAYKFTETTVELEELKNTDIYKAIERAEKNGKTDLLSELYKSSFGCFELYNGGYKLLGWHFDIKKYCKRFLIKTNYENYFREFYAPNKTTLYNSCYLKRSEIEEIIEIEKKEI